MTTLDLSRARWQFRDTTSKTWLPATVPGCVHTDLRRAKQIPDPFYGTNELDLQWIEERDWEYRATFNASATLLSESGIELVADGLDTVATVYLNGKKVAATDNMFIGYRWQVKNFLRAGANELRIVFASAMRYIREARPDFIVPCEFNDPVGNCVRIRKQQCQFGWDWGPRFVTAGIWRSLRLEARSVNRLAHIRVTQLHAGSPAHPAVSLALAAELAQPEPNVSYWATLSLGGNTVVESDSLSFSVPSPQLWWPAGQGAQPLYDLVVTARDSAGRELGTIKQRVGLRTIVLDRHPDQWGESFQFLVNGRAVFIKGANWIPVNSFVADLTRADYARDLRAAVLANMNCMRLWGGGIYESEDFYDLCDELGLLVWHDFMFACTLYPGDDAFLASVRAEAIHQIKRIRHHACLALWCGNNEIIALNHKALEEPAYRDAYKAVFHGVLPEEIAAHDDATPYWPTSPWAGDWHYPVAHETSEQRGDIHYWDVWHARQPVKNYEKWKVRFCSEFGMQSYSSPETQATFAPADANIFDAVMENHQKNRGGNQVILDYVSRRYRFPKSQDDLIYLSQLNQAYCMSTGVEHYRRLMPRCMGAIYWQLNDCWPVASWSSIEFTGKWKALHHVARRFNAPALVSAHVPGDEGVIIGNYRTSTVREVHLHTVYDAPVSTNGLLRWDLFTLDGDIVLTGKKKVALRHGESISQKTLDLAKPLAAHTRDRVYLRIALDINGVTVSEDTVFLAPPRFLELPRPKKTAATIKLLTPTKALLSFTSPVFQHRFAFDLPGIAHTTSDNYFELYPREKKEVVVEFAKPTTKAKLAAALTHRSLVDTYA